MLRTRTGSWRVAGDFIDEGVKGGCSADSAHILNLTWSFTSLSWPIFILLPDSCPAQGQHNSSCPCKPPPTYTNTRRTQAQHNVRDQAIG
ncbi:hypothetical protein IF2G_08516 [Cordyceps javanica]|nr:hypothetical protein IF2G_08516 [Cordyceps javanica]